MIDKRIAFSIVLILPILFGCQKANGFSHPASNVRLLNGAEAFRRKVTIKEAEIIHWQRFSRMGAEIINNEFIQKNWLEFKMKILPNDEIEEFYNPERESRSGYAGLDIVRNGKIVHTLILQS